MLFHVYQLCYAKTDVNGKIKGINAQKYEISFDNDTRR